MRILFLLPAVALLAACNDSPSGSETYTCPNGPDLAVSYSEEGARILFPDGRVEVLPPTEFEETYAKPGIVWQSAGFRTARLTDGDRSYACDQMAG